MHEGEDCTRTFGLLARDVLAVPDGFCWSAPRSLTAAVIMTLVHSARINGHDPYAYIKDVLDRLPTQPASRIAELLPHHWKPAAAASAA